jgi:hypothetical protein
VRSASRAYAAKAFTRFSGLHPSATSRVAISASSIRCGVASPLGSGSMKVYLRVCSSVKERALRSGVLEGDVDFVDGLWRSSKLRRAQTLVADQLTSTTNTRFTQITPSRWYTMGIIRAAPGPAVLSPFIVELPCRQNGIKT